MIVQNVSHDNVTDISFTVGRADLTRALRLVQPVAEEMGLREVTSSGGWPRSASSAPASAANPGTPCADVRDPGRGRINIVSITTSEIRITCLIDESQVAEAGRALHQAFLLEE